MPLTKVPIKPGVNREITSYAVEGQYFDGDKVRFRFGFAEKIGGWANSASSYTFNGVARTLLNWVDYSGNNLLAFGTNQKYYIQNGSGSPYNDITPVASIVTLGTDPFSVTSGSPYVTVTATSSYATIGAFVSFSGATAVGGLTISGSYEIVGAPNANSFNIIASSNATSTATGGGSAVVATYYVGSGSGVNLTLTGWGVGGWGGNAGIPNTGWGQAGSNGTTTLNPYTLNFWSQCNFNQDFIFTPRGGNLYYWQDTLSTSPSTFNAGVTLDSFIGNPTNINSGLTQKGIALAIGSTSTTAASVNIVVDSADYITSGAYVTVSAGGGSIPTGTYVASSYINGSTTVPLINGVTGGTITINDGATLNFSYAGKSVPNKVSEIFSSPIYQFTIAFGANPYDPTNFNTQFNPLLIRWSDQANAYEWVPQTSNQAGEQVVNIGSYIAAVTYTRQEILVLTDAAIYSMQYVGPPYVFSFQLLQDNISVISPNAVTTANNVTYWMGVDKFYMYSGRVETIPCSVRRYVFSNLNKSQVSQIVSGYNEGFNEIWWFYPSTNSNVNDSYVIYNFLDNAWYYGSLNRTAWLGSALRPYPMAAFSVQNTYLDTALDTTTNIISVINSATYPASGGVMIGSEYITYTGNTNNNLTGCVRGATMPNGVATTAAAHSQYSAVTYYVPNQIVYHENGLDDGTLNPPAAINSFIQTADFGIGEGDHFAFVGRMVPDMTFTNSTANSPKAYLTIYPRQDSGSNYNYNVDTMTVTDTALPNVPPAYTYPVEQYTGQVYTRVRGRQMAFKVQSLDLGVQWQLGAMRYDIRPDGRR